MENTGFGDAVVFELAEHLRHRVTEVEPGPPRTILTGWFVREPLFQDLLRSHPPDPRYPR